MLQRLMGWGQQTPLAAFANNPAARNASRRRAESLNNNAEKRRVNNLHREILRNHPNLVQQAQAELNAQEQNGLTPIPPTPQPAAPASNRALAAAQVPLPRNQNNVVAAQRKAAREQPNIWNMPGSLVPSVVQQFEANANAGQRQAALLNAQAAQRIAAQAGNNILGNNPLQFSNVVDQPLVRNSRRLANNAKRQMRSKKNSNAFVSPVGLYGNDTFVENLGSNQNIIMSNRGTTARLQQRLRDRGSTPVANAARRAAIAANPAVAARLAEKASLAPKFPEGGPRAEISPEVRARQEAEALAAFLAAKPANNASAANWLAYYRSQGLRNNNSRIQALLREREREEPAGSINSFVAPGSANSFLNNPEPVVPLSPKIPAGFNARRPLGAPPSLFPPTHARPAGLSPRVQAAIEQGLPNREPRRWNGANITANAQKRLNNNAERRGKLRNSIKAMKASRNANANAAREAALTPSVFNTPGSLNVAALANSRAANKAAAEAVEAARFNKAAWVGQPAPIVAESIPTAANNAYNKAMRLANMRKSCTPCEGAILEKLDTLLDRSKPSNVLGVLKGTGAFVVTQVGAALSDAVAALKLAQENGSKVAKKVAENALKYAQKKLEQLLKVTTLNPETKEKIKEALANIKNALTNVENLKTLGAIITAPVWGPIFVALMAAQKIIEGLTIAGSATYNYLKTVAVPAATAAWSAAKAKILSGLGLASSWMNSTRKSLGKRLYNFGTRVSGAAAAAYAAAGRGADAVSRAMYRLSGREQSDMIKQLVQKVTSLELQGRITSKALEELNAALAVAKPGVVTADVAAEAAKVGADTLLLANAAAASSPANASSLPRLANAAAVPGPAPTATSSTGCSPYASMPRSELSSLVARLGKNPNARAEFEKARNCWKSLKHKTNGGKRSRKNRKASRKASRRNRK